MDDSVRRRPPDRPAAELPKTKEGNKHGSDTGFTTRSTLLTVWLILAGLTVELGPRWPDEQLRFGICSNTYVNTIPTWSGEMCAITPVAAFNSDEPTNEPNDLPAPAHVTERHFGEVNHHGGDVDDEGYGEDDAEGGADNGDGDGQGDSDGDDNDGVRNVDDDGGDGDRGGDGGDRDGCDQVDSDVEYGNGNGGREAGCRC